MSFCSIFADAKKLFFAFFENFRCLLLSSIKYRIDPYKIEEINLKKDRVVIRCVGSRAVMAIPIDSVPLNIINGLPSTHACCLGYYYKILKNKKHLEKYGFSIDFKKGKLKIISINHRTAMLKYLEIKKGMTFERNIIHFAQDESLTKDTDPSQAYFVGILVGAEVLKHGTEILKHKNCRPYLRVVEG